MSHMVLVSVMLFALVFVLQACERGQTTPVATASPTSGSAELFEQDKPGEPEDMGDVTGGSREVQAPAPLSSDEREFSMGAWTLRASEMKLTFVDNANQKAPVVWVDLEAQKSACLNNGTPEERVNNYIDSASITVLFVTETMVGYTEDVNWYCGGAHPSIYSDTRVVRPGAEVDVTLLDVAKEQDIIAAIDADPLVRRIRAQDEARRAAVKANKPFELADGEELCLKVPDGANVSNFAIKRIDHDEVTVSVDLPPLAERCRDQFETITLKLPVKSLEVRKELEASQDAGTLMDRLHPKAYAP